LRENEADPAAVVPDLTGPQFDAWLAAVRSRRAAAVAGSVRSAAQAAKSLPIPYGSLVLLGAAVAVAAGGLDLLGFGRSVGPTLAIASASGLSSVAGFAFSPIAQVMLAPFSTDSVRLVQTLLLCSIATQALAIATLWRGMAWRHLPPFLGGGALGLPIGIMLLLHLPATGFRFAIGLTILVYGAVVVFRRPIVLPPAGPWADAAIGFLGGITGGLAAFPGAAITVWCGMKGWDKMRQRGVYQPFILIMQLLALPTLAMMRASSGATEAQLLAGLTGSLPFVPVALIGTWAGLRIFHRISDRRFEQWTAGLMALAGAIMIS
jgi:uncharacterized protein